MKQIYTSLILFLFVVSTYAQNLPQIINFETADNTNLGTVANDGEGGSVNIANIQFNFTLIDSNGNPTNKDIIYNEFGGNYEGLCIAMPDFNWRGMSIKTEDGSEFDFNGFAVSENNGDILNFTVQGFKNGIPTGTATVNHPGFTPTTYNQANFPDAIFGDIDEVQIISNTDFYGNFDNFAIDNSSQTLGLNDIINSETNFKLFPNPTTQYIQVLGLQNKQNYNIYNITGAIILKGTTANNQNINIQNLTSGLYFLKLDNGNTLKFIKK